MGRAGTRLVGLDVARCLALAGMIATHVLSPREPSGELAFGQAVAGGRASALFAVLAGVTLALSTGGTTPARGRARHAASVALAVRALLVATIGLVLGHLDSGLAVILTYYGVLFLLGLPFLGLRARTLLSLAAAWLVVAPVVSHLVRPALPERGFGSPSFVRLVADPLGLASELLLTGYYPVLPWLAYLLAGMGLGRLALRRRPVQATLLLAGTGLAAAATALSRWLLDRPELVRPLLRATGKTREVLLTDIAGGTFGTTPAGGPWEWLLVVAPHSATPFDLAHTIGSSLAVVGAALLVVGLLPPVVVRAVAIVFGAGTMTLTLYSLHVWLHTPSVWPGDTDPWFFEHVAVVAVIGAVFAALRWRGPLEALVGRLSKGAARALVEDDARA